MDTHPHPTPNTTDNTPSGVFSGHRVRAWRHLRKLPAEQLAAAAKCSVAYVTAVEHCHPSATIPTPETLESWAATLGVTVADFDAKPGRGPFDNGNYWDVTVADMPPMTDQEIAAVGVILRRISDRAAR